ncbi:MAG: 2-dehydro-3-deoxygalactonokinase [Flavitalea sp.]
MFLLLAGKFIFMAMKTEQYSKIISCDWGTSNLRLRLVELPALKIIATVTSSLGIAETHNQWKQRGGEREQFYLQELSKEIGLLETEAGYNLHGVPVFLSGMASSTLGIRELPYAKLPFEINGNSSVTAWIENGSFHHPIYIISGVCSENDVVRGEETQLVGIAANEKVFGINEYLLVLPGTHSKHMKISSGKLMEFKTFMTGEYFNLLIEHSVLRNSVHPLHHLDPETKPAFLAGVKASENANLLHESFMVRTNILFNKYNEIENGQYLSGLLIGYELRGLQQQNIVIAAGASLYSRYIAALEYLYPETNTIMMDPATLDLAVIRGQLAIFNKTSNKNE